MPGDYRHLVVKPGDVEWSVVEYEDVTKSLVLSDFEKLKGDQLPKSGEMFFRFMLFAMVTKRASRISVTILNTLYFRYFWYYLYS